ncbi:hypothetical protein [Pontibacter harenae]|uniref:hypothetical protein n=1 Tax=Pontibacter harenae TaxID=2894083 RepID=UPI001E5E7DA4|nr:hypothetical protein [Pontibacter harenae]MCC9165401.1 hypothetical protein [Pontibacter harenae]
MEKWKVMIVALLLSAAITSCSTEKEFELVIENNTAYVLDSVQFSCAVNKQFQSVDSNSSTGPFFIKYKAPFLSLSEPLLCLSILKYSDTQTSYKNTYGRTFSINDLSRRKTNYLKVEVNPSPHYPTNIFDMTVHN